MSARRVFAKPASQCDLADRRTAAASFTDRLVPRFPSCPPPPGQAAAATDVTPPASVAALSHSCPPDPHPGQAAASGFGHALPDAAFDSSASRAEGAPAGRDIGHGVRSDARPAAVTVHLSPAVALILRLVETARPDLERGEIFARAIGVYAQQLGIPALARDFDDFADVPEFERAGKNRFRSGGP